MKIPTSLLSLLKKWLPAPLSLLKSKSVRRRILRILMRRISAKGVSPRLVTALTRVMQLIQLILRLLPTPDPAMPTPTPDPTEVETPTPQKKEDPMETTANRPPTEKTTTLSRIIRIIRGARNSEKDS